MNRKERALEFVNEGYNIKITGRHVEITDPMKDYAIEKISKIERFMNRIIDVTVIMDIQRFDHRVEIILKAGNIKITSQASSQDMYASIDKAVDKLEAQIRRYKSKIQDHHAKGRAIIDMNVNILRRPAEEEELDLEEEVDNATTADQLRPHEIIKQETLPLKTLTYDEAIMKMELSNDAFLIFKNEADQKLKVIYRRKDSNYGIIEPEC
ncbi:ribosome hibernation-promoting factor, HPF/YfiA family [Candidatus Protochlamydia phocaeensis]|uniref:ribosome hibernation-promoting factor, HPF/YfiA family n=1 Tax=Candidatus Protochlamydia phocaeensis TaxID=1414722 RepID=UPI000838C798|nr:ribosome-associated translation inhibitor RaiA [Candidatus Protochlamydia phocaeensis]